MNRIRSLLVLGAAGCALAAVITSSLDRTAYFYYRHGQRLRWEHPTGMVALVALAIVAETGVAYLAFGRRRTTPVWKPTLLALVLLIPWGMLTSMWVVHAPIFWMLHIVWVWLLIAIMVVTVLVSASLHGYRILQSRDEHGYRAVEQ